MRGLAVFVAFVAFVTSCTVTREGDPNPGERPSTREFTLDDTRIEVEPGESFTIAVEDNASVGDDWSMSGKPDAAVVTTGGDHYVADSEEDTVGGGGTRYFEFEARAAGTTSVELFNCYRGCDTPDGERRYEIAIEVG